MGLNASAPSITVRYRRARFTWFALLLVLALSVAGSSVAPASAAGSATLTPMIAAIPPHAAAVTFQVTYAAEVPQNAREAFTAATAIWAPLLNSTVPIQISVTWTAGGECSNGCTLASAGPTDMVQNFPNAPLANTLYPIALANSLAGTKQNQGADIDANFNSQVNWYFGQGTPPTGQNSLISTAVHELAHGLGFSATLDYTNGQGKFQTPPNIFDRFVVNGGGQTLIDSFANNSTALGSQLTGGSIFFNGPNAKQAAGGTNPKLFAPNPWQVGSSISHLDQTTYTGGPNSLMTPSDEGGGTLTPGPITEAIFKDLGWPGSSSSCGQRFGDVPNVNPACVAIEALAARSIINGCDSTATPPLFCPNDSTLRAQMAALIVRAMPDWSGETYTNTFTDQGQVDAELWRRVATLQHYGVANGYNDCPAQGKTAPCYGPTDPVLRAQAISFITRAMVAKKYWTQQAIDPNLYGGALTGSGHEADAATYWFYTRSRGGVPDYPESGPFPLGEAAPRAWFARLLWNAIQGTPAAP